MVDDPDRSDAARPHGATSTDADDALPPTSDTTDTPDLDAPAGPPDELVNLAGDLLTTGPRLVRLATGVAQLRPPSPEEVKRTFVTC